MTTDVVFIELINRLNDAKAKHIEDAKQCTFTDDEEAGFERGVVYALNRTIDMIQAAYDFHRAKDRQVIRDEELSIEFENWHKCTKQYSKYKLNHRKYIQSDGTVVYYDYRTNWAWLSFKGGWFRRGKFGTLLEIKL